MTQLLFQKFKKINLADMTFIFLNNGKSQMIIQLYIINQMALWLSK